MHATQSNSWQADHCGKFVSNTTTSTTNRLTRTGKSGDLIWSKLYGVHIFYSSLRTLAQPSSGRLSRNMKFKSNSKSNVYFSSHLWKFHNFFHADFFDTRMNRFWVFLVVVVGAVLDSELMTFFENKFNFNSSNLLSWFFLYFSRVHWSLKILFQYD